MFYNIGGSEDAMVTALAVYPYALRFVSCTAASDSPLLFDRVRWKSVLLNYVIDGKHFIDSNDLEQMVRVDEIVNINEDPTGRSSFRSKTAINFVIG